MGALIWATESSLLAGWALVFVMYTGNAFHTFIARSYALVCASTLVLQILAAAQDIPVLGHAASESLACAVSSLLLIYVAVLLDPSNYTTMFSMPTSMAELIPLDAFIGLGWFSAVLVGSLGMALCDRGRKTPLMFHHFGYHMLTVLPSMVILWLYDYGGSKDEPVSFVLRLVHATAHRIFFLILAGLWGLFIFLQITGEGVDQLSGDPFPRNIRQVNCDFILFRLIPAILKLLGRAFPVLIPVSAAMIAPTMSQSILAWTLAGIAGVNVFDFLDLFRWIIGARSSSRDEDEDFHPSAPPQSMFSAQYDPAAIRWRKSGDRWSN